MLHLCAADTTVLPNWASIPAGHALLCFLKSRLFLKLLPYQAWGGKSKLLIRMHLKLTWYLHYKKFTVQHIPRKKATNMYSGLSRGQGFLSPNIWSGEHYCLYFLKLGKLRPCRSLGTCQINEVQSTSSQLPPTIPMLRTTGSSSTGGSHWGHILPINPAGLTTHTSSQDRSQHHMEKPHSYSQTHCTLCPYYQTHTHTLTHSQ